MKTEQQIISEYCSKQGKKSLITMTEEQRKERATKASHARQVYITTHKKVGRSKSA